MTACPPHCYGCLIGHCGDPRYAQIIARKNAERVGLNLAPPELLRPRMPRGLPEIDEHEFITTARLTADARVLMEKLPPDIDGIAAIARSGLLPGSLLAFYLHVPLWTVSRQRGVTMPGHGNRLIGRVEAPARHVLLVDDTAARGGEMTACLPIVRSAFPGARVTRAVVYSHPMGLHAVDLVVAVYPGQHYLEWNWNNAGHGQACAYDFDGILCHDCPPEDDDGGERYLAFLRCARPLYLPRRTAIPLVVTARHERFRAETLAWLDRHGVRVLRLEMRDWDIDPRRGWNEQIAAWKAGRYAASACELFAESEPEQAREIHRLTGRPVLCPSLGRVLASPSAATILPQQAAWRDCWDRVQACPDRGASVGDGCNRRHRCAAGRGHEPGLVTLAECIACVGETAR